MHNAKAVLRCLGKRRSFEYNEVDVMAPGRQEWKLVYEFDVPVVSITLPNGASDTAHECINKGPCSARFPHLLEAGHCYGSPEAHAQIQ